MLTSLLITLFLAVTAVQSCDISSEVSLPFPPNNQTAFTKPNGKLASIAIAVGVEKYTCSNSGKYE